jgi:hypothetical protein
MFLAIGIVDAIVTAIQSAMVQLADFLPALIGAIIVLIVGWFIAGLLGRLVTALLERVGFNRLADGAGITGFIDRTGVGKMSASDAFGQLVKWFFRLIFLEAAASALRLDAINSILNQIVLFIPRLVVALIVVMIGLVLGRFVGALMRGAISEADARSAQLLGTITQYVIVGFAVLIAIEQIGVATTVVNLLFGGLVAALALAFGLAFGLGGRDVAGQVWRSWAGRMQEMSAHMSASRPAIDQGQQRQPANRPQPAPTGGPAPAGASYSMSAESGPPPMQAPGERVE